MSNIPHHYLNGRWVSGEGKKFSTLDPVTGIEGITYQQKFLPGVDFLGAAFGSAALLAAASFFFRKPNKTNNQQPITNNNQ